MKYKSLIILLLIIHNQCLIEAAHCSKIKKTAIFALLSTSLVKAHLIAPKCLVQGNTFVQPVCINTDLFEKMNHDVMLEKSIIGLPKITVFETDSQKNQRLKFEAIIQKSIGVGYENKVLDEYLQNKGYQIIQGKLENRFSVYKKRYPVNFGAFLNNTNEKEMSLQIITNFLSNLNKFCPNYFANGISLFDIGFGNGQFSSSIVKNIINVLNQKPNDISFSGIDIQESFANSVNSLMKQLAISKTNAKVGYFMDQPLDREFVNRNNLVIASHVAYVFNDAQKFIEKAEALTNQNGILIFMHSSLNPIDQLKNQFKNILKGTTTNDTPARLSEALDKSGLYYETFEFHPTINFPKLSDSQWKEFASIKFLAFDADYSKLAPEILETKKIIEFFIQDPLEAFTFIQSSQLIDAFKNLLKKYNYKIPLTNKMQIIVSRKHTSKLRKSVTKAVRNLNDK